MEETLHPSLRGLNNCGCCEGTGAQTPAAVHNRPGLSAISCRIGTHATFKASMLAALAGEPALADLRTRENDDFSIALLDAWAAAADVLTFYRERLANESYLRTATERESLLRLAALIGYALRSGVAASTHLAFTLDETPGSPAAISLEAGIKVGSVPGPGEKAQTYETVERIECRAEWNAIPLQSSRPQTIRPGLTELFLQGTATQLQPGDAILIVGDERLRNPKTSPDKERWDVRFLQSVTPDPGRNLTRVTWSEGLGERRIQPAAANVKVHAFRQRAALFGHNAPDPRILKPPDVLISGSEWKDFGIQDGRIELDAEYPKVVAGSWVALVTPTARGHPSGYVELYHASKVSFPSRSRFALSGKVTRIDPDTTEHLDADFFKLRETLVLAQSEELPLASEPMLTAVSGNTVTLDRAVSGLESGRTVALSGVPGAASGNEEAHRELATILRVEEEATGGLTTLVFTAPLRGSYRRETVRINANVALATHGETVGETLGSGDASQRHQQFELKGTPLTHTAAATASGTQSTLEVRVNDLLWHEVPALFGCGANERIYVTRVTGEGKTAVQFGDGVNGSRLPTGGENVRAIYRKGIGLAGLVKAGQLSQLLSRPLGLTDVINPAPGEGADDPETLADARENAPQTVLTLDRVVSLRDYEDFARAFGGIRKALATWTWDGQRRGVFLTVAGPAGAAVTRFDNLLAALRRAGDPFVPIQVKSYAKATFQLGVRIAIDPAYEPATVLSAVEANLHESFSFETRAFGQPVAVSEVVAVIQATAGVVAAHVHSLRRSAAPAGLSPRRTRRLEDPLAAGLPAGGASTAQSAAELLTLDPGPIDLAVMRTTTP